MPTNQCQCDEAWKAAVAQTADEQRRVIAELLEAIKEYRREPRDADLFSTRLKAAIQLNFAIQKAEKFV